MKHKKDIFRLSSLGEGRSPETRGSINNDINILDSRVFANAMHKNDSRMSESGRSMVEMLGTLAIIGVLSIGGIMGYSYGMDKYRANQTINDIMLKMVQCELILEMQYIIAQITRMCGQMKHFCIIMKNTQNLLI